MVRWQYQMWVVAYPKDDISAWKVKVIDGVSVDSWKQGPPLPQALQDAGQNGWELVNVIWRSFEKDDRDPVFILKRPVAE